MDRVSHRYPGLDTFRALAMMLGILLHGVLSYQATKQEHWVNDPAASYVAFDILLFWIHAFRMEAFFLLAGFFARASLHKGGASYLLRRRLLRLVIPFCAAFVILAPIAFGLTTYGHAVVRDGHPPQLAWANLSSSFVSGRFVSELGLGHLWFLYYLIMLLGLGLTVSRLAQLGPFRPLGARASQLFDRLLSYRGGALAFAPVSALLLTVTGSAYVTTPTSFIPHLSTLGYYGLFVAIGWVLQHDRAWIRACRAHALWYVLAMTIAFPVALAAQWMVHVRGSSAPGIWWAAARLAYAVLTWSTIWAVMGTCLRLPRESPLVRYFAAASYWFYLAHLPLVIAFQIALTGTAVPPSLRFVVVVVATVAVLVPSYELFVRRTRLARFIGAPRILAAPGDSPNAADGTAANDMRTNSGQPPARAA